MEQTKGTRKTYNSKRDETAKGEAAFISVNLNKHHLRKCNLRVNIPKPWWCWCPFVKHNLTFVCCGKISSASKQKYSRLLTEPDWMSISSDLSRSAALCDMYDYHHIIQVQTDSKSISVSSKKTGISILIVPLFFDRIFLESKNRIFLKHCHFYIKYQTI